MTAPFDFDRAIDALRHEHEDGPGQDADATRWRIRESLDHARVVRGRLLATLVVFGLLGTGGVSWAYLSGRLESVWPWLVGVVGGERLGGPPAPEPTLPPQLAARPAVASAAVKVSPGEPLAQIAQAAPVAPLPSAVPALSPPVVATAPSSVPRTGAASPISTTSSSKGKPASRSGSDSVSGSVSGSASGSGSASVSGSGSGSASGSGSGSGSGSVSGSDSGSVSASGSGSEPSLAAAPDLYRAAHQLHFHGKDPGAALAAWDDYLASSPSGRFAIEARYNRAMSLVRLRRYRDALTALQPFARGEIMPPGYRQVEAQRLVERITAVLAGAATGASSGAATGASSGESK